MLGPDPSDDRCGMHSPLALTGTSQCVYIAMDEDVDDAYDKAMMAGAEIVTAPYDTTYGSREFIGRDPEGHRRISFRTANRIEPSSMVAKLSR